MTISLMTKRNLADDIFSARVPPCVRSARVLRRERPVLRTFRIPPAELPSA